MQTALRELEGTWEEVAAHAPELAGRRVKLTIFPEPVPHPPSLRPASGRPLLRHAGTWQGDDFEECLEAVMQSRGAARLRPEGEGDASNVPS